MRSDQIRREYCRYFTGREHQHVPSSPLVPPDDPTLLFTTAGMVQFKPLYSGAAELPYRRACSVQKCLRAGGKGSDLENVGRTLRHHTFFEMLGNFSFGDYFKREALTWAWDFCINVIKLDRSRLFASVYEDDNEAWDIWTKEIGMPENHMVRLGAKDNFWGPAGDTGACGPCSEIYFDRGAEYGPSLTFQYATLNDDDPGSRFLEFWNCVFPQFDQQKDGTRLPLKNRGVDTGMSVERLACITQNAKSLYETDVMSPIADAICGLTGVQSYSNAPVEVQQSVNVIADHVRALTFTLSEGILPGNEGRGYVMRRLLRRAARYARKIGQDQPFMYRVVDAVLDVMGEAYPELLEMPAIVKKVIQAEEEAYAQTLGTGLQRLEALLANRGGASGEPEMLSGAEVFQLTATFGFPFDDIHEVAAERGFLIDMEEYRSHVARHREESRKDTKGTRFEGVYERLKELFAGHGKTEFTGYGDAVGNEAACASYPVASVEGAQVLALFRGAEEVSRVHEGDEVVIVLSQTPFYAEAGGQIGDTGIITGPHGKVQVNDTQKTAEDIYVHYGVVLSGEIRDSDSVTATIEVERRWQIMRNHTATHLLQGALRAVVGKHIAQQGSYVGPDYLRFDFTNPEALTSEQVFEIERAVNDRITANTRLTTATMSLEEARKTGAIAPFGEKYASRVRVIDVPGWDTEFCGGTHVPATGDVGAFIILGESAISAGIRRIEAVTGKRAFEVIQEDRAMLQNLSQELSVPKQRVPERVNALAEEIKTLRKQIAQMRSKAAADEAGDILDAAREIGGVRVVSHQFEGLTAAELRSVFDELRSRRPQALFAVLASNAEGRATIMAGATPDVVSRGVSAGDLIKKIAPVVGGSGGGKKEMAQAGGKDAGRIPEAFAMAERELEAALKKE